MADRDDLHLFEGVGLEVEYMIVDRDSLDIKPIADIVLNPDGSGREQSFEDGPVTWSNELALHVIELKTSGPAPAVAGQAEHFHRSLQNIQRCLDSFDARLLPTAMHPWMNPHREFRRWPHGDREIYSAFDQVFDCRGHGWANLQSMHINLPFQGDEELERLHAAIRLVLPLLPGLAASSPLMDGRSTAWLDNRMRVYRDNCRRIPSITGRVIPDVIHNRADYEEKIFKPMYADIRPHDPDGILCHEWLNARGAIARFDRNTIEIRVMDTQESAQADMALAELTVATVRGLVEEQDCTLAEQHKWSTGSLADLLEQSMRQGELAEIYDARYLQLFGFTRQKQTKVNRLWEQLANTATARGWLSESAGQVIENYLRHGTLARRIQRALHADNRHAAKQQVYSRLGDCLLRNERFSP